MTATGPYATAADTYWAAGWRGILPLPEKRKSDPPKGYTGGGGGWPSYPDIYSWATGREGRGNIGLRMPAHVVGIDVDDYGTKVGGQTLALAEAANGPLPPTWRSTSRDDGVSGIRFYRVPEGLAWPGEIGPSIELIHMRYRYAVAWPSIHPEGGTYRWINPQGIVSTIVPDPDELPVLPDAWVEAYTGGELAPAHTQRVDVKHSEALAWIVGREHATAAMCTRMEKAINQHALDLPGSAHNSTRDAALRVTRLAAEGHHGAVHALGEIRKAFMADATSANRSILGTHRRTPSEADYEFGELVSSAVGVVLAEPSGLLTCDCYGQLTGLIAPPQPPAAKTADGTTALDPLEQPKTDEAQVTETEAETGMRFKDGAAFILDAPDQLPNIWGEGDDCLWAAGEALMIVGPPGVGKTTLTGQVVRGLIGLQGNVLGLPVQETSGKVLYLAMDRPAQIARGLRRAFSEADRAVLADRLAFWEGPPPGDVAKHPSVLLTLAELAGADTIVIDSVKDAAVGLSEDEVAAGYNRARQNCLARGVQVLELHHMVKRGSNGAKPTELADVYGSTWLTAGAGSVLLLWGAAGDPIVSLTHLKQPAAEVGPWRLIHDHARGTTAIFRGVDLIQTVAAAGYSGVTASAVASLLFDVEKPSESQKQKARTRLDKLVNQGHAVCVEESRGALGGKPTKVYRSNHGATTTPLLTGATTSNHEQPRDGSVSRSESNHESNHGNHTTGATTPIPPSIEGDGVSSASPTPRSSTLDCNGCGRPFAARAIEQGHGYCHDCGQSRRS